MDNKVEIIARRYQTERERMIEEQIISRGIKDIRVIDAMRKIPRHIFVSKEFEAEAYSDGPTSIGYEQTISQPYIVALMSEALELKGEEKVLEIGTGSGYQAAILSLLAKDIYTMEIIPALAASSSVLFEELELKNIRVIVGDGSGGYEPSAPYDAIIVTAAAPELPPPLLNQLTDGGRLVIPIGEEESQILYKVTKEGLSYKKEELCPCRFVNLVGRYGFKK